MSRTLEYSFLPATEYLMVELDLEIDIRLWNNQYWIIKLLLVVGTDSKSLQKYRLFLSVTFDW